MDDYDLDIIGNLKYIKTTVDQVRLYETLASSNRLIITILDKDGIENELMAYPQKMAKCIFNLIAYVIRTQ